MKKLTDFNTFKKVLDALNSLGLEKKVSDKYWGDHADMKQFSYYLTFESGIIDPAYDNQLTSFEKYSIKCVGQDSYYYAKSLYLQLMLSDKLAVSVDKISWKTLEVKNNAHQIHSVHHIDFEVSDSTSFDMIAIKDAKFKIQKH